MTSLQEGTQVPATHIRGSHLAKTFGGSHPLNVFANVFPKRMKKFPDTRDITRYLKSGPTNMVYGSNI